MKSVSYCVYSIRFWQFFLMMTLSNIFGAFFSYAFKPYGMNISNHEPISDNTLTWAATIGSGVVNGVARIVMGALVDRYGFKTLFTFSTILQLLNSMVCYWAVHSPPLYFTCILINFWCVGGNNSLFPVAVTNVFGHDIGVKLYVWIMFGFFLASLLNLLQTTFL